VSHALDMTPLTDQPSAGDLFRSGNEAMLAALDAHTEHRYATVAC